jgi:26S proteasome regulatory subunit, ATPase 3, interacting protein
MSSSSPTHFSRPYFEFKCRFWHIVSDTFSPQDAAARAEELGIEFDTQEHNTLLEQGSICARAVITQSLKRKRE